MGMTIHDSADLYVDKRQCVKCGKPTYRLGLESGDRERGEKEPLICNPCLITLRQDMHTEFELRQQVQKLQTKFWVLFWFLGIAFPVAVSLASLLIGKFLLYLIAPPRSPRCSGGGTARVVVAEDARRLEG